MNRPFLTSSAGVLLACLLLVPYSRAQGPDDERNPSPAPGAPSAPLTQIKPLSVRQKLELYARSTYGPTAFLGSAASAGVRQWLDSPPEWGQGAEGYGRRFASVAGRRTIKKTIQFGVGAALGEDPRYFRSEKAGAFPRAWHAIAHTFVVRRDDGTKTFATSRFAGAFAAGFISNTWHPERLSDTNHALSRAGLTIASDAGSNLLKEFWPDLKRVLRRR